MDAHLNYVFDNALTTTIDTMRAIVEAQIAAKDARILELEEKIEFLEARLRIMEERNNQHKSTKTE